MNEDDLNLLKAFGAYEGKDFQMTMHCLFGLQSRPSDDEVLETIRARSRSYPRWLTDFTDALRGLLSDPYISFSKKGDLYLDDYLTDEEAEEHFRRIWKLRAPNEPWPLDAEKEPGK